MEIGTPLNYFTQYYTIVMIMIITICKHYFKNVFF